MFNLFGNSTFGNIANSIVDSRIKSSSVGGLYDYIQKNYGQQAPQNTNNVNETGAVKPIASSTLQNQLGTTPSIDAGGPEPSGGKGIKKIIGMVSPIAGMIIAKHDENQQKGQRFIQGAEGLDEPVVNPFGDYV